MADQRAELTAADTELLRGVAADEVTWRADLGGRISYRRWSSETEYVTVTPRAKRLAARRLITNWHNPSNFGRGGVGLTPHGSAALSGAVVPADNGDGESERLGPD